MANVKISQLTPKGANLEATDLLEISEFNGSGYETKSITGQEIIDAAGGGGVAWGDITGTLSSQTDLDTALSGKQETLVSGTNIKTLNGGSLLGSGGLSVQATLVSGTNIKTINGSSVLGSGNLTISGGGTNPTNTYLPINNAGVFADSPIKLTTYGPGINVLQTDNLFGFEVYDAQGYQMASLYGSNGTSTIGIGSISSDIGVSLFDASIRITNALIDSGQSPITPGAMAGWLKFADENGNSYYLPYYI
jgi:hypothetical protein